MDTNQHNMQDTPMEEIPNENLQVDETHTEETQTEETQTVEKTPEELETDKTLQALELLPELMEKLEEDNKQYELHVQLIETLKQVDLPDELERARENMHHVFPLTEALWLDWIHDAKKEANTEQGYDRVLTLYNQAQEDYLSINIWKSYVEFILQNFHAKFNEDSSKEESNEIIQTTRDHLLHAVGATQFHIKQSQEIWKPFSEFELELLNQFKEPEQQKRVYNMYLQRLGTLHIDYQDTFDSFSSFISTWDNSNYENIMMEATKIYSKTKRAAEERDIFEMKLISCHYSLDSFYEYIENEKVSRNMSSINNVKCLYERAIVIYCLDPSLWEDYILFLIEKGKIFSQLELITKRAIRNCPWSGSLYAYRARLLESDGQDQAQINELFDTALNCKLLLSSMDDLVTLLLAKIDYVRRKIDWEEATEDDLIDIQLVFVECLEYLHEAFPDTPDPYYRIEKYYAFIAEKRLFQVEKARELWQDIVEHHGRDTEAWIHYITFERNQENYQVCESLFKKALQKNVDNPMRLIDTWNSMEHEFGTLESFESAAIQIHRKVKTLSRQWQAALTVQEERNEVRDRERNERKEKERKANEVERKENEKRKKGLHRMEQKKKKKEKKATINSDKPQEFKKPFDIKKDDFKKPAVKTESQSNGVQEKVNVKAVNIVKEEKVNIVKEEKVNIVQEKNVDNVTEEKVDTVKEEKVETVEEKVDTTNEEKVDTEETPTNIEQVPSKEEEDNVLKRKASDEDINKEESKKHKSEDRPPLPRKPFNPLPRAARSRRGKSLALHGSKSLGRQDVHQVSDPVVPDATSKSNDDFRNMLLGKK